MSDNIAILRILRDMERRVEHIETEAREMGNVVVAEEAKQLQIQIEQLKKWVQSERHLYRNDG